MNIGRAAPIYLRKPKNILIGKNHCFLCLLNENQFPYLLIIFVILYIKIYCIYYNQDLRKILLVESMKNMLKIFKIKTLRLNIIINHHQQPLQVLCWAQAFPSGSSGKIVGHILPHWPSAGWQESLQSPFTTCSNIHRKYSFHVPLSIRDQYNIHESLQTNRNLKVNKNELKKPSDQRDNSLNRT